MTIETREGLDQIPEFPGYKNLLVEVDGELRAPDVPLPSKIFFEIEGTTFHMALHDGDGSSDCAMLTIWCSMGHLPYTAEDPAARRKAIAMVRAFSFDSDCAWTPVVDGEDGVVMLAERMVSLPMTPPDLIWEAFDFYRQQRGAIDVMKRYLR